jgi:hypothetical protein
MVSTKYPPMHGRVGRYTEKLVASLRKFSNLGLAISVKRKPSYFSDALLELEQNMEKYKKSVQDFSARLTWEEVADKHLHLYNHYVKIHHPRSGSAQEYRVAKLNESYKYPVTHYVLVT